MKSITIKGSKRESLGKAATRNLRNAGQVPCVVYGGESPTHFSADEREFSKLIYTPNVYTVDIDLGDGTIIRAIKQDVQFHPVKDAILHVDFYELNEERPVTMEVPVRTVGSSRGVLNGGVLRINNRRLKVRALPANLPDMIECDITPLKIGGKIYVHQKQTEDYTILHPDNEVIVMVKTSRNAVDVDDDEDEDEAADVPATEQGAEA